MATVDLYPGPPPTPTITGDIMSVSVLLNSPPLVQRTIEELTESRFVTPQIFGRGPDTTAGAVAYDQVTANDRFLSRDVSKIAPGAEFPLGTDEMPTPLIAAVDKWGERVKIPLEAELRNNSGLTRRAFKKIANTIVRKVDAVGIAALQAAPTLDYTFDATWGSSDIDAIMEGLIEARLKSTKTEMGYHLDTVLLNNTQASRLLVAAMATSKKLLGEQAQEGLVRNGFIGRILDFDIYATEAIAENHGWFLEKGVVGDISDERPLNTTSYYRPENESWYVQGSRSFVPYVTDPLAAVELIGI
jgi:hypothetical protein